MGLWKIGAKVVCNCMVEEECHGCFVVGDLSSSLFVVLVMCHGWTSLLGNVIMVVRLNY